MEEKDASWLIERATKQFRIATQMTSGILDFSVAVARSCEHVPLRPAWQRHAAKDAADHRKLQTRLKELLGNLYEKGSHEGGP